MMAPKAEPEPTPERPRPEPEPEKEPPMGEPGPEWEMARQTWGAAWEGHWIGMAVLFGLLTIFAIYCLLRIYRRKRKQRATAKFALTVTAVIALFTSTRFLYLIINPYESPFDCIFGKMKCPLFINRFLYSVGLPSLASAYLLLFFAFQDVMKMKKIGKFSKLQNWWFLGGLVVLNYAFACTADLTVAYVTSASLFLALCQGYFILFSLCLVVAFLHAGVKIYLTNRETKSQISRMSMKHSSTMDRQKRQNSVQKVVRLAITTAVLALFFLALQIYALAFVYMETYSGKNADSWTWLIYQFVYRVVELAFAASILYNISFLPKKRPSSEKTQRSLPYSTLKVNEKIEMGNSVSVEVSNCSVIVSDTVEKKAGD